MRAVPETETPLETTTGVASAAARTPDPDEKGELATEAYARDHADLSDVDERNALDFLLAPKAPRLYDVVVQYETEAGSRPMTFVVRGTDGRKLDAIEMSNVSEATGRIDQITADCQLVVESTVFLEAGGRRVELSSEEFLTIVKPGKDGEADERIKLASPVDALEARFKTQLGLISGVSRQIRVVSGYDPARVGSANRRLVNAAGNS